MVPRIPSWTKGVAVAVLPVPPRPFVDKRCCSCSSPWSSVALRGQKVLQLQFSVSLRGPSWTRSPCPSVALRGQKVLQFCSSPCPSVALRGQKVLQLQFSVSLRGPSWTKGVAVAVLRVPPWLFVDKRCCSCSSPCPSVALRGQKVLQLQFSVSLRGPSWTKSVAVAVLRGPPWPFVDKRCCSSAVLRVPPWPFVDKRCCSCSSPCPSVALRGQKVLQFCSSPCPSVALRGQKVLQLQFSVSLRGPSSVAGSLRGQKVLQWSPCPSVALRGQKVLQSAVLRVPPWPFVDKRCCSCSSPCPSVALRGQSCSSPCPSVLAVAVLQFSVSLRGPSWTKGVAVAVLRVPPWIKKPFFLPYRVY